MSAIAKLVARIGGSFIFWAAWIIIPIIMEIVPALGSCLLLVRRKRHARRLQASARNLSIAPAITLLVPVYNSADTLEACIDSVAQGTYPLSSIQLYLINNNSQDDSFGVYARCQKKHPELVMQWMDAAQGKSRALNLGLFNSRAKYIVHIDSDGVLEPHALENLVARFESDSTIDVVTGVIMTSPDLVEAYRPGPSRLLRRMEFVEYAQAFLAGRNFASEINFIYSLSGAFTAFRSNAVLSSWLYNTDTICEDTQITFQMRYLHHERLHVCENAIFFVDPIESVDKLYTQRQRWQRGSLEVAHMFGGEDLSLRGALRDVNVNTLLYDHTFAFPRMIWYIALICLLAVGYSVLAVLGAVLAIYVLYVACGYLYYAAVVSFLRPFDGLRRYYARQWWVVPLLPLFNLAVFFIRLAGIVNSIGTDSAWKTATLTEERDAATKVVAGDLSRPLGRVRELRAYVNDDSKEL